MVSGPTNGELAQSLCMSSRTVKFHLENIRGKLGGISRIQTCLLAVHHSMARHADGPCASTDGPCT
ncbi:LuxR C-terminal-related transcriptional regulator [Streptomyces sp. NPDC058401]|uniref:LuxR C-terminal-related transcriptional regulator n=1 Tax=Streptomyces sp. NPDC058401 TaxID=3346480 RepID=UPI0036482AA4